MTSRHHYSIPGASFLKPRSSSKTQAQKTTAPAPSANVPSSSRDTRQPSSSRTYHTQEAASKNAPPRPPSASGYRTQHPNASVTGFHASSNVRQTPTQRPTTTPPASSSRTRLDVPDTRGYFSKMFSRKQTPVPLQGEEQQKSSQKDRRSSEAHQGIHSSAVPLQAPSFVGPSTSRTAYDASLQARDSDREERARRKAKDDGIRAERTKEERERRRAEYAASKMKQEEAERVQAAASKVPRTDRTVPRASREERRQQDYESDNAKRRLQAQQMVQTPAQKQEARQSYYLHPVQASISAPRATALTRDGQQPPTPQLAAYPPGVPVQPSSSSQSTSVSHQAHVSHPVQPLNRIESTSRDSNPAPVSAQESAPAPPPKSKFAPYQTPNHPFHQNLPQTVQAPSNMLPPYPTSGPDVKHRLDGEAAERDAVLLREREREQTRRREAAEKDAAAAAAAAREGEREHELERRRDAEKEAATRELREHRERERERELERERRRARRAERERRKEFEHAERERQKQAERAERERLKALEQLEREKQKEAERLRREKKEQERAEKQRARAEWERQEVERVERERLRIKSEKERASKSASKHRSHRDKSQSLPTNPLIGAASGSDTDRMMSKKDVRHRSHSQSAAIDLQTLAALSNTRRPDSRKDSMQASNLAAAHTSQAKKDVQQPEHFHHESAQFFPKASTPLPIQSLHVDNADPRSVSIAPVSSHDQDLTPPKVPERSRTDPLSGMQTSMGSTPSWNQTAFEGVQPKLVSIYASQGPSDRTAFRVMQKTASGHPSPDQRLPVATSAAPPVMTSQEGQPRSSLDQPSRRASVVQPIIAPSMGAAVTSSLGQAHPSRESPISMQEIPQSRTTSGSNMAPVNAASRAPQVEKSLPTPTHYDLVSPSPDMLHSSTAQNARQPISTTKQQQLDDRFESIKPAVSAPHGTGFSSYSQSVFGLTAEPARNGSQDQHSAPMSRAPSNNSTRSPSRRAMQLPPEASGGTASFMPVSRTDSDASHTTETWERQQFLSPHSQPHAYTSRLPNQHRPAQSTPASATFKAPLSSRVKHESLTNFHAQSVPHTHSHSQSLPQQMSLPYRNNSSKDDIDISSHDNLANARAKLHIPGTAPDVSHQQYPPAQVAQSKIAYNPSTNASVPVQSQQLPSTVPDHRPPSRSPMNTNNVSSYSAAVASQDAISQMPSAMLSHQQSTHQSNNSMYNNHSTSRNVSAHQPQHYQQGLNSTRTAPPQHTSTESSSVTAKPPGPPRSANSTVYVTSTHRSGPFVEDSPSSAGGGLSLDSPPLSKPLPQFPNERPARQSTYSRPQSQIGPPTPVAHNTHQSQAIMENQRTPRADSPPPLTPSSSHESHEEILMTPASLDQARGQVVVQTPTESSHRPEKKKGGGLLRLFRSSSTKSTKDKEIRDRLESKEQEVRKQVPGLQRDQRTESLNKPRSTRPPTIVLTAEPEPNLIPPNAGTMPSNLQVKQPRATRHVPPPISIPTPDAIPFRLFSSKSRRYRTMSAASMEAVDGTANNTVVGSPTSSRRSPTPSGPLTPSVRDPIEAAQTWRDNEEVFLDPGSQRRRRPGVTFDLRGDEGQKDGALYRRVSRIQRRRDSSR
ncbi:hypothetical protein ACEPAG_5591 [Sanghuangporus baumii]